MKAIISGASKGIGKAIATALAEKGYDLILIARQAEGLEQVKEELSHYKIDIMTLALDLSMKNAFEKLKERKNLFSNLTVLVNNVGVFSTQNAENLDLNILQKQIDINLFSAIQLTQLVLPYLKSQSKADIINIGSVMSLQSAAHATDYSISKHALKAWNDGLREGLRKQNIKVGAIYPGSVSTPSWDGIDADRSGMIQTQDIAEAVIFMLKTGSSSLVEEIRISPRSFSV